MAISVAWDNHEKTVLCYEYTGTWNWDDLYAVLQEGNAMIDTVPHHVGVIIDMSASARVPPGTMINAGKILKALHPRILINAVINHDPLTLILAHTFLKLYGKLYRPEWVCIVPNIEAARRLVAEKLAQAKY